MSGVREQTLSADGHEIYARRRARNKALGLCLGALVLLIAAVTVVKIRDGIEIRGFDHTYETTPGQVVSE